MVVNQLKVHPFQSFGFRWVNLHQYMAEEEGKAEEELTAEEWVTLATAAKAGAAQG